MDESEGALIGGHTSSAVQLPSTLYLESGCTAAKVGPKLLLTAAHCAFGATRRRVSIGPRLRVTTDPAHGYTDLEVASVHVHPTWEQACTATYCSSSKVTARLDMADVAVIEVVVDLDDVPATPVTAAPLSVGDRVTLIGFGCTKGARVSDDRTSIVRADADAEIVAPESAVHEGSPIEASDVDRLRGNYLLTKGPGAEAASAGLCPGDSGGPLYTKRDGETFIAGVNSNYTFAPDDKDAVGIPITNWHTRLDDESRHSVASWLRSFGVMVR